MFEKAILASLGALVATVAPGVSCYSADRKMILALAWEPWQELFQGVIRCLHSDFRIGGLAPGETKKIRGKVYFVRNDVPAVLEGYLRDLAVGIEAAGVAVSHVVEHHEQDVRLRRAHRGWFLRGGKRINVPCSIHADGTGLTAQDFIGGHPEWAEGSLLIGRQGRKQVLYDVDRKKVVGQWGNTDVFPDPEGDIALSPDGQWFVNGHKDGNRNLYTVYRRSDGAFARSGGIDKGAYRGDIRIDPSPRWNRTNDAILVPGLAANGTRQMHVIRVITDDR